MKVAIIGTVGVPANYGGFETLVENLLSFKSSSEIEYTIYCSAKAYTTKVDEYKGAKLKYLPLHANGWQVILYDNISLIKSLKDEDIIIAMGCACAYSLAFLHRFIKKPIIIHFDGLDFTRDKFNSITKFISKTSKKLATKYADAIISDNQGIVEYVKSRYNIDSVLIEYGGDNASPVTDDGSLASKYNLLTNNYSFKVARIEPENNIEMILEAYSKMPNEILVIVGNWGRSEYGNKLRIAYQKYDNLKLLDPIYNPHDLNILRSNCKLYIHGHSVGGTNPSLVEAMSLGLPIIAFDCVFNRATTENNAIYFEDSTKLQSLVKDLTPNEVTQLGQNMKDVAERRYKWSIIADKYEKIINEYYNK